MNRDDIEHRLNVASRQYRSNISEEYVTGYDRAEIEALISEILEDEKQNRARLIEDWSDSQSLFADRIRAFRDALLELRRVTQALRRAQKRYMECKKNYEFWKDKVPDRCHPAELEDMLRLREEAGRRVANATYYVDQVLRETESI